MTLTTLSLQPRVFTIDPLLTEKECNWIIKKAEPEMVESPVSLSLSLFLFLSISLCLSLSLSD
eukprot:COSAG03_NODE_2971_length_2318_cov_17.642632_2_plen_63_part_00